jgi:hypothetical protein
MASLRTPSQSACAVRAALLGADYDDGKGLAAAV